MYTRTKKLTDTTYSATIAASETAIRGQVDGSIQECFDMLAGVTAGNSGSENVGSAPITGLAGSTVYTQVSNMLSVAQAAQAGAILPGVIADTMLSDTAGQIKDKVNSHIADNTTAHGINTKANASDLALHMAETANSIMNYIGNPDGVTPNDTAFTNAKVKGNIYFPQNSTSNAIYYFTATPVMDNLIVTADAGVKLSFPTTNSVTFKNVIFNSDVQIISRDRNNTGKILKNDFSKLVQKSLSNIDISVGVSKLTKILQASLSFTRYYTTGLASADLSAKKIVSGNKYKFDYLQLDTAAGFLNAITLAPSIGQCYSADFEVGTGMDASHRAGIMIIKDYANFVFFSCDSSKTFYIGTCLAGVWTETSFLGAPSMAYTLTDNGSFIISARMTASDTVEIYINGLFITKIKQTGMVSLGFAYNSYTSTMDTQYIGNITSCTLNKANFSDYLNIAVFGDSITTGEGSDISWADFLPYIIESNRGIAKVTINNQAVSGQTASQQYTVINATSLTSYKFTLVMVGTNDIQQQTDITAFETTIQNIITKIIADGSIPILGIPPMFIDNVSTGYGFATSNYYAGGKYRSAIMRICAENNVMVADVMSEFGKIGADNVQLRDNLHPQPEAQVLISKCFAKAILKAITNDL